MTIRYVQLDGSSNIVASAGDFANPQPGLATSAIDDQSAKFLAYRGAIVATKSATLDAVTLAGALIAKGLLAQADVTAAVQNNAGATLATAVASISAPSQLA